MVSQLDTARGLIQRGRCIIPIPRGNKAPAINGWSALRITESDIDQHFTEPCNIGLLLGEPSGWLIDIDLDVDGAARAAPWFFPATYSYGRNSRPGSHLLITCHGAKTQKYTFQRKVLLEIRSTGAQSLIPPSQHPSGELYRVDNGRAGIATIHTAALYQAAGRTAAAALFGMHWDGGRHDKALALAGALAHAGWTDDEVVEFIECIAEAALDDECEDRSRAAQDSVKRHREGNQTTGWPSLAQHFDEAVLAQARKWLEIQDGPRLNGASYSHTPNTPENETGIIDWPEPLADDAYHGLVSEVVQAIEPHSEADPTALLVQFLTAFGSSIGRGPHLAVEGDQHTTNLFTVMVGDTAKGRKGTSWGRVHQTFSLLDDPWIQQRVQSGLSSGEGLIWAVRDPIYKREKRGKGSAAHYEEVISDVGITDKRLLVIEAEFASTLRVMGRDGDTLSPLLRQAWDRGNLRSMTKNSPATATAALISIIGHITVDELRRYLDRTEVANGFANRFIFVCVRRSKCLPEGGTLEHDSLIPYAKHIGAAIDEARKLRQVNMDESARDVWRSVYPELSEGLPGLLGAVTSRAEAQVLRLSLLYALLDRSVCISPAHLMAALAVWEYAENSARYIFGSAVGDPIADEILRALKASANGLSRTDISELFKRHKDAQALGRALELLERKTLARREQRNTTGRPSESWQAC